MVIEKSSSIEEGKLPITVSTEVVSHLSFGLYRNFARAVKELISNSYDAGATEVKIKLDLDNKLIIIRDNGNGMSLDEIKDKFLQIAHRTPYSEKTDELGRKRIGTFGIGFLSTFPYCKEFELITKKKNVDSIVNIHINTNLLFENNSFKITDVSVPYEAYKSDLPLEKGETIIILKDIAPHIVQDLAEPARDNSTIDKMSGYDKFKWTLAQYAPIEYPPIRKDLRDLFNVDGRTPMRLWLNGDELYRNVPDNSIILESGTEEFGSVLVKYVIMSPKEPIKPREARGLQVRLRDVAIGFPRDFDAIKITGKVAGKLNYLCGEIHVLSGLESSVMIDRDNFSYTTDISNMEEFFRKKLNIWNDKFEELARKDKEIYIALNDFVESEKIENNFKDANLLYFSKERLRIPKSVSSHKKSKNASSLAEVIKEVVPKNEFKVVKIEKEVDSERSPVKVVPEKKEIYVYNNHPSFREPSPTEKIIISSNEYEVFYDKWDISENPDLCKLDPNNKVFFNLNHPLLKKKDDILIKKLVLGIHLIVSNRNDNRELLLKLNKLIEEIFMED